MPIVKYITHRKDRATLAFDTERVKKECIDADFKGKFKNFQNSEIAQNQITIS